MNSRLGFLASGLLVGILSSPAIGNAATYLLDSSTLSGNSFGTVTLNPDTMTGKVDISVTLNAGYTFSAGGYSLAFDMVSPPAQRSPQIVLGLLRGIIHQAQLNSYLTAPLNTRKGTFSVGPFHVFGSIVRDSAINGGFIRRRLRCSNRGCKRNWSCRHYCARPRASMWAMMILGFGGIGLMAYRRTRFSPVAA